MRPREFCRQSLQVLAVPGNDADAQQRAALETLLGFLATDDLQPEAFEVQLGLLADSEICPCFSQAAKRVLELWREQQAATSRGALTGRRN
jgi:hypothetical protein